MKIRNGFVSNSSSSSFTCDVCGETYSGWDACLSEAEMYECQNGHTFCDSEALDPTLEQKVEAYVENCERNLESWTNSLKRVKEQERDDISWYEERVEDCTKSLAEAKEAQNDITEENWEDILPDLDEDRYDVPTCYCPICQMDTITNDMAAAYMRRKFGVTYEEMKEEIKTRFKNYSELCAFTSGE